MRRTKSSAKTNGKINAIHPPRATILHSNERADYPKANKGFTPLTKSALWD